ncbi:hypothetical protein CAOG_009321 [Capsaspora owczarzaki ATCC 30864]|nr:hypothetical protein CAOG_009321 [Capsaspora owczarzaki ATCC 30864]
MHRLFLLFRDFTSKPENFLKHIKETCVLLNLSPDTLKAIHKLGLEAAQEAANPAPNPRVRSTTPKASIQALMQSKSLFRFSQEEVLELVSHHADAMTRSER